LYFIDRGDAMTEQKITRDSAAGPEKKPKETEPSNGLGVCDKAFSSETTRLEDKDEPCEDGIQR
jgi:hypothetical protein